MSKQVKKMFVFTASSMLGVGILNFMAEASKKIKDFLTLNKSIGPYSGKILFGILVGFLIAFIYYKLSKESKIDINRWTIFLLISLIISSLLVFTPFIDFLLKK